MSIVFESTIKMVENSRTEWYIELKDTINGTIEICSDLQEYSKKIEELGKLHGGIIDEVKWSKDVNVHPIIIDNIRFEMSNLQRELEDEIGEPLINGEKH
ncbi:MAG: hypothetical protein PHQ93_03830 [Sulfurimonas sp.]|uniref:hypothetical protein n=1 Tax=Sulfurimonas sp. TaxID=2022749 RepID=UPI002622141B|nr:hypothetical protein [Sulfurimonas sp.]MDD5400301.1 hypothetical protein [Sulfurimonas sp.]